MKEKKKELCCVCVCEFIKINPICIWLLRVTDWNDFGGFSFIISYKGCTQYWWRWHYMLQLLNQTCDLPINRHIHKN